MAVRDLGYKPYEGERLPASHNTIVLLRHGLRRAWASWLVKIAVFLGWGPAVLVAGWAFLQFRMAAEAPPGMVEEQPVAPIVLGLLSVQMWLFATLASLGAGASVIAEDLTHRAFQFYFAKPVTPAQYLLGRVLAVALFCFLLLFIPGLIGTSAVVVFAPREEMLGRAGLVLPALFHSGLVALTLATVSVGLSSLSRSRALTMSAWIMVFLIPEILAGIVFAVAEWPWLGLASLPTLINTVGLALFRVAPPTDLRWFHAAPILVAATAGSVAIALVRLRRAEVIT
jgi:ABC-2 type transport system permease protein